MGWHLRVSRFGSSHQVFKQQDTDSCGPSCALMLFQRLRGVKLSKGDSYRGYDAYGNENFGTRNGIAEGAAYDGSNGTWFNDMSRMLRNTLGEECRSYRGTFQECTDFALARVRNGAVAVGSIGWYNAGQRNGGHWVIFDQVSSFRSTKYMVTSDPADGHVHVYSITANTPFSYHPDYGNGRMQGVLDGLIYFPNR